jgi:hypothetical protein
MRRYEILSIRNTSNGRQQMLRVIAFRDVPVRSKLDGPNDEGGLIVHAEYDDLRCRVLVPYPPQQFQA